MLERIRLVLLALWTVVLLIFFIQNWGSPVTVVLAGQAGSPVPLSWVLLVSYGVGVGLGFLYVGSWRFHNQMVQRQAIRKLHQLMDRIRFLESQAAPPSYYLPSDVPEAEYTPDPSAGRYSYGSRPPERIWPDPADQAPGDEEHSEQEDDGTFTPHWRTVHRRYPDEEEEWDS